ncbi:MULTISPECIES: hypothetical protein, partial [Cupriavidus]
GLNGVFCEDLLCSFGTSLGWCTSTGMAIQSEFMGQLRECDHSQMAYQEYDFLLPWRTQLSNENTRCHISLFDDR